MHIPGRSAAEDRASAPGAPPPPARRRSPVIWPEVAHEAGPLVRDATRRGTRRRRGAGLEPVVAGGQRSRRRRSTSSHTARPQSSTRAAPTEPPPAARSRARRRARDRRRCRRRSAASRWTSSACPSVRLPAARARRTRPTTTDARASQTSASTSSAAGTASCAASCTRAPAPVRGGFRARPPPTAPRPRAGLRPAPEHGARRRRGDGDDAGARPGDRRGDHPNVEAAHRDALRPRRRAIPAPPRAPARAGHARRAQVLILVSPPLRTT